MTARRNGKAPHRNGKKGATPYQDDIDRKLEIFEQRLSQFEKSNLALYAKDDYHADKGDGTVAAVKAKRNRKPRRNSPRMPIGSAYTIIMARAVKRCREKKGIEVPEAAEALNVHTNSWYKIESGIYPATLGTHIESLMEFFFPKLSHSEAAVKMLEIGTPEPDSPG